jgi:hypothetical protein
MSRQHIRSIAVPGGDPTKNLAESSHAKETQRGFVAFGSLAIFHAGRG